MKDEIRKRILSRRAALCADEAAARSAKICAQILKLPEYKKAKNIMVYMAYRGEVMTDIIAEDAEKNGKRVFAPVTVSKTEMIAAECTGEYKQGRFGIDEPVGDEISPGELDFIIVPGVAFDKKGNRIGYGAGYYDRFLLKTEAFTVGIAYDFQIVDEPFAEETDVKLHAVISE